jgi:hypothetical protein
VIGSSVAVEVVKLAATLVFPCVACQTAENHLSFDTSILSLPFNEALETYHIVVVVWLVTEESVDVLVLMVLYGTKQFLYVSPTTIQICSESVLFTV